MADVNGRIRATLVKPPPIDSKKSPIENLLDLTELGVIGPNIFTNTRPLWHPPGARGIYGGAVIAQCLAAAQLTVPSTFTVHSMHCYFVLAGDSEIPVLYHVEEVRSGKSFATRTVQARQRGKAIFTTTMSFVREGSGGAQTVAHRAAMPADVRASRPPDARPVAARTPAQEAGASPFESRRLAMTNSAPGADPSERRTRQWIRARGPISPAGGHQAHLSALAYMSDSYFIGTVSRVHDLWRFNTAAAESAISQDKTLAQKAEADEHLRRLKVEEGFAADLDNTARRPEVGMMVSLDHSIYFHQARGARTDEWLFTEMQTPWAGDGRGLVTQHIWAADGTLIATCIQEGVVRLRQDPTAKL